MSSSSELPEYAVRNRASWTKSNEDYTHEQGVRAWRREEISWGVFGVPESELNALPDVKSLVCRVLRERTGRTYDDE